MKSLDLQLNESLNTNEAMVYRKVNTIQDEKLFNNRTVLPGLTYKWGDPCLIYPELLREKDAMDEMEVTHFMMDAQKFFDRLVPKYTKSQYTVEDIVGEFDGEEPDAPIVACLVFDGSDYELCYYLFSPGDNGVGIVTAF